MFFRLVVFIFLIYFNYFDIKKKSKDNEALKKESNLKSINRNDPESLYKNVQNSIKKNDHLSAINGLEMLLDIDPDNIKFYLEISEVYFDHLQAKETYLSFNTDSSRKQYFEDCLWKVNNYLQTGFSLDPENYKTFFLIGKSYLLRGENEDAIKNFNKSLKIEFDQEETHMLLGFAYKAVKKYNDAIFCFKNAVNIEPQYFEAHMQLAEIFNFLDDEIAVVHYENALELEPDNKLALFGKAWFYHKQKEWDQAIESYYNLLDVDYTHADANYNLGSIHLELKNYDMARNHFADVISTYSEHYKAYYAKGHCNEVLGNVKQAEVDYKRAIEIYPGYKNALEALRRLQNNNKKYNK